MRYHHVGGQEMEGAHSRRHSWSLRHRFGLIKSHELLWMIFLTATYAIKGAYSSSNHVIQLADSYQGAASTVAGNHDMGVQSYSFPVVLSDDVLLHNISYRQSELRVYLRLYCNNNGIAVKGFGGLFPRDPNFPAAMYFYKQPLELQFFLRLSVSTADHSSTTITSSSSSSSSKSWPVWWMGTDRGKADMGLWPLEGPSNLTATSLSLRLRGSTLQYRLQVPTCSSGSGTPVAMHQHERSMTGIWNVVTTTDPNQIPAEKLSRLLLLHSQYHQRLGYAGTILRCNAGEAKALAAVPQLKHEIDAGRLVIWPWVWGPSRQVNSSGHLVEPQPYFWQVPRNQLALLATYGRKVHLSFFDMDEYLVLPKGGTISSSMCAGKPLMDHFQSVTTITRYPALCNGCTGQELDCWEQANTLGSSGRIQLTQCPCLLGKSLLAAGTVVNTKVHKSTPARGFRALPLEAHCGYLIHLQALISSQRPWDKPWDRQPRNETILIGDWVARAHGSAEFRLPAAGKQLMNMAECKHSGQGLLRRCNQA